MSTVRAPNCLASKLDDMVENIARLHAQADHGHFFLRVEAQDVREFASILTLAANKLRLAKAA